MLISKHDNDLFRLTTRSDFYLSFIACPKVNIIVVKIIFKNK